jgi:uncharacterized protein
MSTLVPFMPNSNSDQLQRYGPWALVTGASDGIGKALALDLARRGFNLVLVARRESLLFELANHIETAHGRKTVVIATDLGRSGAVAAIAEKTSAIDIGLVAAAAGFGTAGAFMSIDDTAEINMVDVNCRAVLETVLAFAPRMKARGNGGIILLSSIVAFQGVRASANYAATKAYVQSLGEGIADDLAAFGIDVLTAAPGPVASGFATRARMTMGAADTPDVVARQIMEALGRRSFVRPGRLGRLLGFSLAALPRTARRFIMARIMSGMARQSNGSKNQDA